MHAHKTWPLIFALLLAKPLFAFAETYTVGIAPSLPEPISLNQAADKTKPPSKEEAWQAVFNYLSEQTHLEFQFESASSQLKFELNLAKGYYDFAYINPLQFIAFNNFPGYRAVVKQKAQPIRGMIFVKKTSNISNLGELRENIIAFPGALNFSGSIAPRASLDRLNVNIIPRFLASQKQVYVEVSNNTYIGGGGTHSSFEALPPEIKSTLRIIWDSPGYTPNAFVAHSRISFFAINTLQRAMVGMIKREDGKILLPDIFVNNGFEVARDSDWNEIKLIDLNKLNGTPSKIQAPEPITGM